MEGPPRTSIIFFFPRLGIVYLVVLKYQDTMDSLQLGLRSSVF